MERVSNGSERIAQFVSQNCQELILDAIACLQLRIEPGIFDKLNGLPGTQIDQVHGPIGRAARRAKIGRKDADELAVAGNERGTVNGAESGPAGVVAKIGIERVNLRVFHDDATLLGSTGSRST